MRKARRTLARSFRGVDGPGLILLYHRIAEPERDPQLLSVTPAHFREQLEVLRTIAQPVPLRSIRDPRPRSSTPPVAVTFDDGYGDNLLSGLPLLESEEVPATFFVVSGFVQSDHELYWDELERVLLYPTPLPPALELDIGGESIGFDRLDEYVDDPTWHVLREDTPSSRHAAYRSIMARLHPLDAASRRRVMTAIRSWAGVTGGVRASHRPLAEAELRTLDAHPLAEVGAHTVDHPSLAALTHARQREEVAVSKSRLAQLLDRAPATFSYPYGGPGDYSKTTVGVVRAAGFELACANVEGRVGKRSDRFQLPRMIVRDWDGDEFERRLRSWLTTTRPTRP